MNKLLMVLALISAPALAMSDRDIEHFQPAVTQNSTPQTFLDPDRHVSWYTSRRGLAEYLPQVTSFDGRGRLLASWTPNRLGVKNRPTFILLHGGHGIGGHEVATAMWARDELAANVLVLDSFWSRGRLENWLGFTELGANMRALDAVAAGRFVIEQGADPGSVFLMGESQGGWAVLRAMTNDPFFNRYNRMFRAGIALYPVCRTGGKWGRHYAPPLGPYNNIVAVFTGGRDTATPVNECDSDVFTQTTLWQHYPNATHGFDVPFLSSPNQDNDGRCVTAMNVYNKFAICRSNSATVDMRSKIKHMVQQLTPYNIP
jgi:dienelactone hydrolase